MYFGKDTNMHYLVIIVTILLMGCTNSTLIKIDGKYSGDAFAEKKISIYPLSYKNINKEVKIERSKGMLSDGGVIIKILLVPDSIYNYLQKPLADYPIKAKFVYTDWKNQVILDNEKYFKTDFPLVKDSLPYSFQIPDTTLLLNVYGFIPDLVFKFEKIEISMVPGRAGGYSAPIFGAGGMFMGGSGGKSPKFKAKYQFIIWDYVNNKPVCYGRSKVSITCEPNTSKNAFKRFEEEMVHAEVSIKMDKSEDALKQLFEKMVRDALSRSPIALSVPVQ
jgi:hypothetical protein